MKTPERAKAYLKTTGIKFSKQQAVAIDIALNIAFEEGRVKDPEEYYKPELLQLFLSRMRERVSKDGIIKTGEAWDIAKGVAGYSMICNMMRAVMSEMESKGVAIKLRRGVWVIQHKQLK